MQSEKHDRECRPFCAFRFVATSRRPRRVLGAGVGRGVVLKLNDDGGGVAVVAVAVAVVILYLQH